MYPTLGVEPGNIFSQKWELKLGYNLCLDVKLLKEQISYSWAMKPFEKERFHIEEQKEKKQSWVVDLIHIVGQIHKFFIRIEIW